MPEQYIEDIRGKINFLAKKAPKYFYTWSLLSLTDPNQCWFVINRRLRVTDREGELMNYYAAVTTLYGKDIHDIHIRLHNSRCNYLLINLLGRSSARNFKIRELYYRRRLTDDDKKNYIPTNIDDNESDGSMSSAPPSIPTSVQNLLQHLDEFLLPTKEISNFTNSEIASELKIPHTTQDKEDLRLIRSTANEAIFQGIENSGLTELHKQNAAITPISQLLLTIRYFSLGSVLVVVGDFCGIHKSTASRTVKKVSEAIASLRDRFINFPDDPHEIGYVGDQAENFRNRKEYYSFNVQTICDANLCIRDIVARWPGSSMIKPSLMRLQ
ncbi:hypothetical protein NQ317_018966 [Molorchus minor]|uniref:Nuclease HARBI1 n=1 Tax=Molorchus minor TaxID=1323400 RepID=A0ABQ9JIV2_9CUCU|nr:hypothetical protein NQ317_018966 [Molorchus minor]